MMIYDTHCHLDLIENMPQIIREIENDQIGIFAVGTTPKAYQKEIKLCIFGCTFAFELLLLSYCF